MFGSGMRLGERKRISPSKRERENRTCVRGEKGERASTFSGGERRVEELRRR